MTSLLDRRTGPSAVPVVARRTADLVVPLAVVAVVLLRLVYVAAPLSADEGGFLAVGAQWHAHGSSLYGDYWVDRPPLLVGLFSLASRLGGLTALRLLGCVAAAITVAAAAAAAGHVSGDRARRVTAVVAALLLSSPLIGATAVNGELLAAPFVAGSLLTALLALDADPRRAAPRAAAAAGALAVAAVLVKQNMVDGAVLAAACWGTAWVRHDLDLRRCRALAGAWAAGAGAALVAVLTGAWLLGSSPRGVYDAMYPFRVHAAQVLARSDQTAAHARLDRLVLTWAVAGLPLVLLLLAGLVARQRARRAAPVALLVALVVASGSVLAGGSWWTHYLVQLAVPSSVALGVLVAERVVLARLAAGVVATVAVVGWVSGLAASTGVEAATTGRSIAAVARPGDTVLSAFGDGGVVRESGLRSPYPYLWALPVYTLDPQLALLDRVLAGRRAPTWVVVRGPATRAHLDRGTGRALERRYHPVGRVCGREVLLRDGATRARLRPVGDCRESIVGPWGARWFRADY